MEYGAQQVLRRACRVFRTLMDRLQMPDIDGPGRGDPENPLIWRFAGLLILAMTANALAGRPRSLAQVRSCGCKADR